jgi:hypothetical protein
MAGVVYLMMVLRFLPNVVYVVCCSETFKPTVMYGINIQNASIRTNHIKLCMIHNPCIILIYTVNSTNECTQVPSVSFPILPARAVPTILWVFIRVSKTHHLCVRLSSSGRRKLSVPETQAYDATLTYRRAERWAGTYRPSSKRIYIYILKLVYMYIDLLHVSANHVAIFSGVKYKG